MTTVEKSPNCYKKQKKTHYILNTQTNQTMQAIKISSKSHTHSKLPLITELRKVTAWLNTSTFKPD